ncbi:MAG TPA: prepilin-type N-terminal cleavage/methylation domain-containing protein [Planctomycetota bacterium]|nr:prepilin-type N-terminal cleavage/methylation domain-containing protein [Planctomycetota bacterium]
MMNNTRYLAGFTLIELLVVLMILTVLSTIAVQSLDHVQDQSHYDATKRAMVELEHAIVGQADARDSSGAAIVTGFIADLGRLPKAVDHDLDAATPLQPAELWQNPFATGFAIRPADATNLPAADSALADAEVKVPCGWRGPYLRMPFGESVLNDGWGKPFDLRKANRTDPCLANDLIEIFRSLGSDNTLTTSATNDYREDLYLNLKTDAVATYPSVSQSNRVQNTFTITVHKTTLGNAPTGSVELRMFGPNPDTGLVKAVSFTQAASGAPLVFTVTSTIGPRMFRAYEGTSKSAPRQVTVTNFEPGNVDLVLKP